MGLFVGVWEGVGVGVGFSKAMGVERSKQFQSSLSFLLITCYILNIYILQFLNTSK